MIDTFASQYKWTDEYTLSRTYFQLKQLSERIAQRQYVERKIAADSSRVAHGASREQYDRYIRSLNPEAEQTTIPTTGKVPTGIKDRSA